jgi:hypothetical protein
VVLVLVLGVVAFLAQLAGVGTTSRAPRSARPTTISLATILGGSVPDIASTSLNKTSIKVAADETVRMSGSAKVTAAATGKAGVVQVVCGIRYARDHDASWSLGIPYETVVLKRRGASEQVTINRSFTAPAADTYRMSMACHVASPAKGAKVTATGSMRAARGLPSGAAIPVE